MNVGLAVRFTGRTALIGCKVQSIARLLIGCKVQGIARLRWSTAVGRVSLDCADPPQWARYRETNVPKTATQRFCRAREATVSFWRRTLLHGDIWKSCKLTTVNFHYKIDTVRFSPYRHTLFPYKHSISLHIDTVCFSPYRHCTFLSISFALWKRVFAETVQRPAACLKHVKSYLAANSSVRTGIPKEPQQTVSVLTWPIFQTRKQFTALNIFQLTFYRLPAWSYITVAKHEVWPGHSG